MDMSEELIHSFVDVKKNMHEYMKNNSSTLFSKELAFHIICKHSKNGILSLSDLRNNMRLAPSTMTSILTYLEDKKLIKRIIDKNDRRNIFIKITDHGICHLNESKSIIEGKIKEYVEYMGKEDVEELIRILQKTTMFLKGGNN